MHNRGQRGAEDHRKAPEGRGVRGRRHHRLWEVSAVLQRRPTGGNRESGGDRAVGRSNAPLHTGNDVPTKEEDESGQEEGRGWNTKLETQPAQLPD